MNVSGKPPARPGLHLPLHSFIHFHKRPIPRPCAPSELAMRSLRFAGRIFEKESAPSVPFSNKPLLRLATKRGDFSHRDQERLRGLMLGGRKGHVVTTTEQKAKKSRGRSGWCWVALVLVGLGPGDGTITWQIKSLASVEIWMVESHLWGGSDLGSPESRLCWAIGLVLSVPCVAGTGPGSVASALASVVVAIWGGQTERGGRALATVCLGFCHNVGGIWSLFESVEALPAYFVQGKGLQLHLKCVSFQTNSYTVMVQVDGEGSVWSVLKNDPPSWSKAGLEFIPLSAFWLNSVLGDITASPPKAFLWRELSSGSLERPWNFLPLCCLDADVR